MKQKRILFLNYCYPGQGTYYRCYYFAKHMAASGYKVYLLCSSPNAWDLKIRTQKHGENFSVITLPSPIRPGSPIAYLLRAFLGILWVLFKKYDIIHAFGVAMPSTAIPAIAARWFKGGTKIVIDWDDAWGDAYGDMFGKFSHSIISTLESKTPLWAKPDAITVVSRYFKVKLLNSGVEPGIIHLVPNGSDTERIRPVSLTEARKKIGWAQDDVVLLSMGHNYFESLRTLMEVFSLVVKEKPEAKLMMLGNLLRVGRYAERTDALIGEFKKISANIEFLGEVPHDAVGDYLCAADCLVMPMENSVMDEARAPIRVGDYLASGRPVVSNAVGYSREALESAKPNGVCSDPDNYSEFAEKILEMLNDPEYADKVGKAGLKLAQGEYNWKSICGYLESVYSGFFDSV